MKTILLRALASAVFLHGSLVHATAPPPQLAKDIYTGGTQQSSNPSNFRAVGGTLFFTASDVTNGSELWKSDGTAAGTVLVKDINPGSNGSQISSLTAVGGTLFFSAFNGTNGYELWKSDGTAAGTVSVKNISPGSLTAVGSTLFFAASDATNGAELWKSDGTAAGTVLVKDIYLGTTGSGPTSLTAVGGTLFFAATDATKGVELWKSDGTTAGTVIVKDINPLSGSFGSSPSYLKAVGGTLFFAASDGINGTELWTSDGTATGTVMVNDIYAGANGSSPQNLTAVGSKLFFAASEAVNGTELYVYEPEIPATNAPSVSTPTSTGIGDTSITLGGDVTSDGGATISERGVICSPTSVNDYPQLGDPGVIKFIGTGTTGVFTINASGLSPATQYSFRAYAINSAGTGYSITSTFILSPYTLTVIAANGTVVVSPQQAGYAYGTVLTLTAIPDSGNSFIDWGGAASGSVNPTTVTMNGSRTVTANFTLGLPTAVDTPGLTYTLGGQGNWFGQNTTKHDSVDAAQSGVIGNDQESSLQTSVTGPGNLDFWWKVSSEAGYDFLEFYIDGAIQPGSISGTVNWTQMTYTLPAGTHTLRWRYKKDATVASGSDAGWLDQVVWTPSGSGMNFASWQTTNFNPTQLADPLISGLNADADDDGLKNLVEFAFGLNPNSGTSVQLPQALRSGGNFIISFTEPAGITGVTYGAEWSPDLTPANWLPITDTGTGSIHTFSIPTTGSLKKFMRLKVTSP